jgi:L-aminopeptidase/D-esterase-like protein
MPQTNRHNAITDVPGIRVGHAHDPEALTGCTVVLCEEGAVGGVDQRGGAPGTRETDLLRPMHLVEQVHAVLLAGGSAFGLDAAGGVMDYLEERGVGFDTGVARVPIVPAAILFDLDIGDPSVRPDAAMGHAACQAATAGPPAQGCVGAGTGARVGGITGPALATKSGIGTASLHLGGVVIGALVAVNCFGDVIDPSSDAIIAGARTPPDGRTFVGTLAALRQIAESSGPEHPGGGRNTVVGVVATNARLAKEEVNKVAQMAQDGLARVIRPAHTLFDGDTLFALATGHHSASPHLIGAFAPEVVAQAILNGVRAAEPMGGLPSASSGILPPEAPV